MSSVISQTSTQKTPTGTYYPESDGNPMAETDIHRNEISELITMLERYFEAESDVYVTGNIMFYYEEGNPKKFISPDVMVVRGINKGRRRVYKLWEERVPDLVIEVSSRKTWGEDLNKKWKIYEQLGVKEYYIHDPEHDYLPEPLVAYKLIDDELIQVEIENSRVFSEALGLELVDINGALRLYDPKTEKFLMTSQEAHKARLKAEAKLEETETELARLHKELEQLKQKE